MVVQFGFRDRCRSFYERSDDFAPPLVGQANDRGLVHIGMKFNNALGTQVEALFFIQPEIGTCF